MNRNKPRKMDALANQLYDLLADAWARKSANDEDTPGYDIGEISAYLGVRKRIAEKLIRKIRLDCGKGQPINIIWRKDGPRYVYFLSDDPIEAAAWHGYRIDTEISYLETHLAIIRSLVAATDGRTAKGKVARMILKHLSRLFEDITEMQEEVAPV